MFSVIIVRIGLGVAIAPDTVQGSAAVHVKAMGDRGSGGLVNELSTFEASDGSSREASGHFFQNASDLKKSRGIVHSDDTWRHAKNERDQLPTV